LKSIGLESVLPDVDHEVADMKLKGIIGSCRTRWVEVKLDYGVTEIRSWRDKYNIRMQRRTSTVRGAALGQMHSACNDGNLATGLPVGTKVGTVKVVRE
jgi:hypothetical protein